MFFFKTFPHFFYSSRLKGYQRCSILVIDEKIVQGIEKENLTIGKLLDVVTSLYPNVEAAIFDHLRKTWTQFKEDVDKFALGLLNLGIKKGEKAGVWALNIYEWMVAWFALPKIGMVLIPMDHWYQDNEAEFVLNHSESVACICTSNYVKRLNGFRGNVPLVRHVILMDEPSPLPEAEGLTTMKTIMNLELNSENKAKLEKAQEAVDKHDVTFILYTSGTTGVPKGAMLTHFNIIKNCVATANVLACSPQDKYLIPVPFSHCFGCVLGITLATLTGSPIDRKSVV